MAAISYAAAVRAGVAAIALTAWMPAMAQSAADVPPEGNDEVEIVVTGLKTGNQTLATAPASVAVISGEAIENTSADSIRDFVQTTPGVSIDQTNRGGTQIQIRGINARIGSASVGFYMDDLPFSFINLNSLPDPSPYDLESIEILRGSQGALYGAGSSGGVVLIRTKDPVLNRIEGKADGAISFTDGGGTNGSVSAALNLPIIEDKLGIRGSFSYQTNSGWIDDTLSAAGKNMNDEKRLNARIKLLAKPTDDLAINLVAVISRIDRDFAYDIADDDGKYPQSLFNFAARGADTKSSEDYEQYGATITYDLAPFTIRNSTSFIDYEAPLAVLDRTPIPSLYATKILSNELRLNSNGSGPFKWVAGFYYRDAKQTLFQNASFLGLNFNADDHTKSEQFSIYGEGTLSLLDNRLDLAAGASYFEDKTRNVGNLAPAVPAPVLSEVETKLLSPQFTLSYHPTPRSTIYARYAEGFRPGIIDFSLSTYLAQLRNPLVTGIVNAEKITSYEIGAKGLFLDGKLYAELVFFYNEIDQSQQGASFIAPVSGVAVTSITNAGKARSQGIEWSLGLTPTDGLDLKLTGSYTDAEIAEDFYSVGANPATTPPAYRKGDPLYLIPKWAVSATASYRWEIGAGLKATLSASTQFTSERTLPVLNAAPLIGDEILRTDLRAEIGRDSWSVYAFADNVNNEDGLVTPNTITRSYRTAGVPFTGEFGTRLRPRTIGLGARLAF